MDPSLSIHLGAFQTHEIDGKALVLLTTTLLMEHMQFKLGPALKISSIIDKLKGNRRLFDGWLYYIILVQKLNIYVYTFSNIARIANAVQVTIWL